MLWTAPANGIAMWHIAVAVAMWPESANGYKQTLAGLKTTSALHPGADLPGGVAEGPFVTQREHRSHDHRMQQHDRPRLVRVPIWDPNPTSSDGTRRLPAKPYPEREIADIRHEPDGTRRLVISD